MFDLNRLVRKNILGIKPYSSARDEFSGDAHVFLDANENSLGSPLLKWYNRYPDPYQRKVKEALSNIKQVDPEKIFLGNGSDECIDLLYRCFCEPGKDNVIICPPTYGMYEVSASINDVQLKRVAPFYPIFN
ncbi:MAG: aminotransferase class I/II-fold pyridoxal phosphate-dependent enzyme [Chitinophagaceae bacterium]|nr:aminotransferase class I/II-fold pyridoxal phosphate-dependent enzyme [Chitinophagaceae bacterium]